MSEIPDIRQEHLDKMTSGLYPYEREAIAADLCESDGHNWHLHMGPGIPQWAGVRRCVRCGYIDVDAEVLIAQAVKLREEAMDQHWPDAIVAYQTMLNLIRGLR